jgi:hypothetical protein
MQVHLVEKSAYRRCGPACHLGDCAWMTAYSEEILPVSEQRGATWPCNALLVEVQPLTPPKSRSRKLATIFKLSHYRKA